MKLCEKQVLVLYLVLADDLYTEVTVTAGLSVQLNMHKSEDFVDVPIPVEFCNFSCNFYDFLS